jgi:hypothetical protein
VFETVEVGEAAWIVQRALVTEKLTEKSSFRERTHAPRGAHRHAAGEYCKGAT